VAGENEVSAGQAAGQPVFDSYGRLSWNPTTRELEKIETQHADNKKTIKRHGGVLGVPLDDGVTAWKAGVRRPGFETLLERASTGASQGIAVWHVDRLFRQPRDLERLIDLADSGFRVISSRGTRDLSNPDDRFILRIEVAHAARSSDDTSRRIKRRNAVYRERGRTTGGRPGFGFPRRDRTWRPSPEEKETDRPNVPDARVEAERRALRDAVDDLLAGLTNQSAVARRWNEAGLLTSEGVRWNTVSVRETLTRPMLAGRIEYGGELIGNLPGEPVIEERKWLRLRAMIDGRRRGRPPSNRYLGSGILRCGRCGKKLGADIAGSTRRRQAIYKCNKLRGGCGLTIDMHRTDAELRALTIARLSDPRHAHAVAKARAQVSDRLAAVEAEIREIEHLQSQLSERLGRREIKLKNFDESNAFLNADLEPLLKERDALTGGVTADGPIRAMSSVDVARQWDDTDDTAERRAMLRDAIGMDQLSVGPATGRRFDPERIKLVPHDAPLDLAREQ
jgi:DNA invertase Pin-like site-specific DNA recombinase